MPNLNYLPGSVTGPLMADAVAYAEELLRLRNPHFQFDREYLEHERAHHGGIPELQWFAGESQTWYRLTRFLNMGGVYDPPIQESMIYAGADRRTEYTLPWALSMPNIGDGCGSTLAPFARVTCAPPYEETREINDSDLLCFDCRTEAVRPAIVVWINRRAVNVPPVLEQFTDRVAENFGAFLGMLGPEPRP
ncbi:MAG TPA: hypothetical protein VG456_06560 [Candidatus Sulfopaludibacter sp.]|jgi:hypothetical protein|nr:hypothetical protein [Candidatus Sulfopaludibacter sp.]